MFSMIGAAHSAITDLKVSTAQIFDVQWYISGGRLYASSFNYIYASINYSTQTASAARWTAAQTADAGANGRYIGFFNSTTNPGTYGMAVFNSDGTRYKTINNTGSFRALADGAIFYNGNGMWGTLITTGQGYSNDASGNWAVTQEYPTNAQLQAYTPPTTVPLSSGQTAAQANATSGGGGGGGGGGTAPVYTSDITTTQTATLTDAKTRTANISIGNKIYLEQKIGTSGSTVNIDQTGSYNTIQGIGVTNATIDGQTNTINIKQGNGTGRNLIEFAVRGNNNSLVIWQAKNPLTGAEHAADVGGHYTAVNIDGNLNNVNVKQVNAGGANSGHFNLLSITGNSNTATVKQGENGEKKLFTTVTGSNNVFDITQQGTGAHYLDLTLSGNGHSVVVNQKDSAAHKATINLSNNGGASSLNLVQQSSTAQIYSITQSCATLSGCSVSVTQGQ